MHTEHAEPSAPPYRQDARRRDELIDLGLDDAPADQRRSKWALRCQLVCHDRPRTAPPPVGTRGQCGRFGSDQLIDGIDLRFTDVQLGLGEFGEIASAKCPAVHARDVFPVRTTLGPASFDGKAG